MKSISLYEVYEKREWGVSKVVAWPELSMSKRRKRGHSIIIAKWL
jgi:hypothetical protein